MDNVNNICIFCLSSKNTFLGAEHIFPESLGNKEKILSKGMVCDKCNNEILASLDKELIEFEPIKFCRTFYGVESKRGKVPISNFHNIQIDNSTKSNINIKTNSKKIVKNVTPEGFQLNFRGNRKLDKDRLKLIARALYKIGFELICLDHGKQFILSDRFNDARDLILGKKDFEGYLIIGTNKDYINTSVTYRFLKDEVTGKEFAIFDFNYMFIRIFFDFERRISLLENGFKHDGLTHLKF